MALMIQVEKRRSKIKGSVKKVANVLNKRLKRTLYLSVILNILLLTHILIGK